MRSAQRRCRSRGRPLRRSGARKQKLERLWECRSSRHRSDGRRGAGTDRPRSRSSPGRSDSTRRRGRPCLSWSPRVPEARGPSSAAAMEVQPSSWLKSKPLGDGVKRPLIGERASRPRQGSAGERAGCSGGCSRKMREFSLWHVRRWL